MVVVFYNSGPDGFINTYYGGPLSVSIAGTFPNGSQYSLVLPATGAVIRNEPYDMYLEFEESGFSFVGSNLSGPEVTYVMTVDSPAIGVQGTITWTSVSCAKTPTPMNSRRVSIIGSL